MKIHIKIGLGLSLLLIAILGLSSTHKALASAPPSVTLGSDFKFTDSQHITGTVNGNLVTFYDSDVSNGNSIRNWRPQDMADPPWCNYGTTGNQRWGINIASSAKLTGGSVSATIGLGYENTVANSTKCIQIPDSSFSPSSTIQIDTSSASAGFSWQGNNIVSSDGKDTYTATNQSGVYINQTNVDNCEASGIIVTSGANGGVLNTLSDSSDRGAKNLPSNLAQYLSNPGQCKLFSQSNIEISGTKGQSTGGGSVNQGDPCTGGADCVNGQCSKAGGDCTAANTQTTCEANSNGFSFAWAVCPILDAASHLTNVLLGLFEDQLSFTVGQLGSSTDANSGASHVHQAWALMRDIATALVVVVMLIMVFSQAVSFGPFDAYTVRKLLPKLVAAVILIQISWVGVSWMIDLVNAIGKGLADLMYWPFNGSSQMGLFNLLGNAKLGGTTLGVFDYAALGVAIALGVAFLFSMIGVAFVAITALFFAILTLIFRKILIIIMLIFVPLAILAWILPGTERYFKLWRDNFIKVMFMFPIAVAIIAAGRIFAYVVGTQDNGQFLNLLFILVGFFGPLFILPKTFKWGGQAMQMAGNGLMKASSKVSERPKKFMDARQEGWSAERRHQSQERFARNEGFNWKRPWRRPVDLVKSGQVDPTLWGRRRQHTMDSYVQSGEESYQKDLNAAEARIIRERQEHRAKGGDHDLLLQAIADGRTSYNDPRLGTINLGRRGEMERMAARKQLAKLGAGMNWRYLENYFEHTRRHGSNQERAEMRKFFDDNVETILPKLPHIYKSIGQAADADPGGIAQMHGVEVEAVLSNLSREIQTGQTWDDSTRTMRTLSAQDIAGRQSQLTTFLQNFQRAVENSQRGGPQLENGTLRAVKGFLDRDPQVAANLLNNINQDAVHGRLAPGRQARLPGDAPRDLAPLVRASDISNIDAEHAAILDGLRNSLAGAINENGYVMGTPQAQQQPPTSGGASGGGTPPPPAPPTGGISWTPGGGSSTPIGRP